MLAAANIGAPSKFSGKNSDWLAFKTQWEIWVQTMSQGDGSDDKLIFANLAKVLDDGEAANLLRLRNQNPQLNYKQYWKGLIEEKERFQGETLKQTLEGMILESKGKMTLSKCKEYTSNFQRIASQIPYLSAEEAMRIILRQIPHYLALKLQNKNHKRRKNFKVKISGLHDVTIPQFQMLVIEQTGSSPKSVGKEQGNLVVEAFSSEQKAQIEALNGSVVADHGMIQVSPVSGTMSVSQCMQ